MPRDGAAHRDGGRLAVPGLPDHNDIRILPQQGAQPAVEGQARQGIDLHLGHAADMAFHRILDRRNVDRAADQLLKGEIQSGGLPAAGRPCQIYDAVGILQHTLEFLVIFLIHPELGGR